MKIRHVTGNEAALLAPLNAVVQTLHAGFRPDVFRADPSPEETAAWFSHQLAQEGWFALLAEQDGAPVGYVLCELQQIKAQVMNHARTRGFLHQVVVAETARRKGVGLALVEAAKARFRADGATVWAVTYWRFNAASAGLAKKAGAAPAIVLADGPL